MPTWWLSVLRARTIGWPPSPASGALIGYVSSRRRAVAYLFRCLSDLVRHSSSIHMGISGSISFFEQSAFLSIGTRIHGLSHFCDTAYFHVGANSHTVAARSSCTLIPLTLRLWLRRAKPYWSTASKSQIELRLAHLDRPGLDQVLAI